MRSRFTFFAAASRKTRVEASTAAPSFVTRPEFSTCKPFSACSESAISPMRKYLSVARQFKKRRHAGRNSTSFTILHGCSASAAPDFNGTAHPEMDNGRVREVAFKAVAWIAGHNGFHHRTVGGTCDFA